MNHRFLALICTFFIGFAPAYGATTSQPTPDHWLMTQLRKGPVQATCGALSLGFWALYIGSQRRHSSLATSAYPQRQRRAALQRQLATLTQQIAKEQKIKPAQTMVNPVEDVDDVQLTEPAKQTLAVRHLPVTSDRMQQYEMLQRQIEYLQKDINQTNSKVSSAHTQRCLFAALALILSGATVAPWCKKAPVTAPSN